MRILYMDEDSTWMRRFVKEAEGIKEIDELYAFFKWKDAVDLLTKTKVNIIFLSVDRAKDDCERRVNTMMKAQPDAHIVFVSKSEAYAYNAFQADVDGYLLKPYGKEEIYSQIMRLKKKFHLCCEKNIYFSTIPRFDLYIDGRLVMINKKKAKEMLALLVDAAGGSVSSDLAINCLWENRASDEGTKALLRMTVKTMRDILRKEGIEYILLENGSVRALDVSRVTSDYFMLLKGVPEAIQKYQGEYMSEYSWAEVSNARLARLVREKLRQEGETAEPPWLYS